MSAVRFAVLGVLLLATAACGGAPPTETTAPGAPPPATAAAPTPTAETAPPGVATSGQPAAARVNGVEISRADFERALARSQQNDQVADQAALAESVLDMLIEQALIE